MDLHHVLNRSLPIHFLLTVYHGLFILAYVDENPMSVTEEHYLHNYIP
jgi:hypothetical protein